MFNQVSVPMWQLDNTGAVKPNLLFHRTWDKLHSRCIEYPFAASEIGDAQRVLDVGTVKSDPVWIEWLEGLPIDVHAIDYDEPAKPFRNITFYRADVRRLPFSDNTFDKILAVSVVEHIGLHNPQVLAPELPAYSADGDLEAVRELVRVLKIGGILIMTLPFGLHAGLILGKSARSYTIDSIKKFEAIAEAVTLHYYEYQHSGIVDVYREFILNGSPIQKIRPYFWRTTKTAGEQQEASQLPDLPGAVTWRRVPMTNTKAIHNKHVDGIVCGLWRRR